jgi:hypothetical protein
VVTDTNPGELEELLQQATDPFVGVAITEDEGWGGTGQVHGVLVKAIEALERNQAVSRL